ncbi:N-acetyltransferase 9 [Mortierella polycephala]|uniref:N-acetyltransferase 9 n=1 Tax=Mortierella polycephala TaxID=41804 RepID=A0A9P6QDB1_9FUNG|nr:N-acetyltransferase 9 [Mortierella polycephala]
MLNYIFSYQLHIPMRIEMVGDVNLFFNDHDDPHSAEVEIMVAGKRKGVGLEALRMMVTYAYQSLGTTRITAKVSTENTGSIQLFLTQLRFVQISYSQIFEEVTLERILSQEESVGNQGTGAEDAKIVKSITRAQFEALELSLKDLDH